MSITYKNLWEILIYKDLKRTQLKEIAGVSSNIIAKLGKNEPVSFEPLVKICLALGVDIGDVISIEQK